MEAAMWAVLGMGEGDRLADCAGALQPGVGKLWSGIILQRSHIKDITSLLTSLRRADIATCTAYNPPASKPQ